MRRLAFTAGFTTSVLLAGCTAGPMTSTPPPLAAQCDDSGLVRFIGQKASADLGAQLLAASGARTLRWGPPRSP